MHANLEIPNIDQHGGPRVVAKRVQIQIMDQLYHLRDGEEDN